MQGARLPVYQCHVTVSEPQFHCPPRQPLTVLPRPSQQPAQGDDFSERSSSSFDCEYDAFFLPTKNHFFPTANYLPSFSQLRWQNKKKSVMKACSIFARQIVDHHNFAGYEIQTKQSKSILYVVEIDNAAY